MSQTVARGQKGLKTNVCIVQNSFGNLSISLDLSVDQLSNQHLHAEIKIQLQERGSDFMLSVCFGVIHLLLPACDG